MYRLRMRRAAAIAIATAFSVSAVPALAGICFTSGKVYVQQKVWDKAAAQLECARKEEPNNIQAYSLLALARAQLTQYASSGAAFSIGIEKAKAKKDENRLKELEQNRTAVTAGLFNKGIAALNKVGKIEVFASRSASEEGSPQAKVEKERGAPRDFAHFTEGTQTHEFWYYPDAGVVYHFESGAGEPTQTKLISFPGPPAPETAIADTTTFPAYSGTSRFEEAAYYFMLAMYVDPSSADIFKNLSYVYEMLGRTDDAMTSARLGLAIAPKDEKLARNLRAAAIGRGNRLFADSLFCQAVSAYRMALANDPAGKLLYMSQIASSWYLCASGKPDKSADRAAAFDSALFAYDLLLRETPPDSTTMRESAYYNMAVIRSNQGDYKKAAEILGEAVKTFPQNKDLLSLAGQTNFQAGNIEEAVRLLRLSVALDPKEPTNHQFLFMALAKQTSKEAKEQSVAEYSMYKALTEGTQKTGSVLKVWVDSADNRLGPNHQLKKTFTAEGYPEEVRTFHDGDKALESWFYWSKGKAITFMEGQVLSRATFPPVKS